ncbi:MAG: hypothetical protein V4592_02825 [Bacteroidota bacterium]
MGKIAFTCIFLSFGSIFITQAQKLPNVQQHSLRAPENTKIDGKATEWNNKYQAHNDATNVFYTIANNNDFLYLIVHAEDPAVVETLTSYGFTFGLQTQGKKGNTKDAVTIRFPLDVVKRLGLTLNKAGVVPDTAADVVRSVMTGNNNILQQRHQTIIVNGIKGLDTLSVYNDTGFKVAEAFDSKRNYTLEIAIPLKYLEFIKTGAATLAYHLLINGYAGSTIGNMPINTPPGGFTPEMLQGLAELEVRVNKRYARTDFWGEYTLAKKP